MGDVTPQLKALVEEQRRAAEDEELARRVRMHRDMKAEERLTRIMADIEAGAPSLDAGHADPTKWLPSDITRIGYCLIATSSAPNAEHRAIQFVRNRLAPQSRGTDV